MRPPRVLFVMPRLPSPASTGAELRSEALLLASAELGPTAVFGLGPGEPPPHPAIETWRAASDPALTAPLVGLESVAWLVRGGSPYAARYSEEVGAELETVIREFAADIVVIRSAEVSPYIPHARRAAARVVLDGDEVGADRTRSIAAGDRHHGRAVLLRHLAARIADVEGEAMRSVDQVWFVSDLEVAGSRARYPDVQVPQLVVTNAVDVGRYPRASREDPRALIYPGIYEYLPNEAAARFLVDEVMPLLPSASSLTLIGGHPPQWMRSIDDPRIVVTGHLPDVRPYFAAAGAMPIPLFAGGGTRLKALEAFATGLPVVSTAKGVEGLAVVDGRELLLAEDGAAFAAHLERLAREPQLAADLTDAGLEFVRAHHSLDVLRDEMRTAYAALEVSGVSV